MSLTVLRPGEFTKQTAHSPKDSPLSRRHSPGVGIKPYTQAHFLQGPQEAGDPGGHAGMLLGDRELKVLLSVLALSPICSVTLNQAPSLPVLGREGRWGGGGRKRGSCVLKKQNGLPFTIQGPETSKKSQAEKAGAD